MEKTAWPAWQVKSDVCLFSPFLMWSNVIYPKDISPAQQASKASLGCFSLLLTFTFDDQAPCDWEQGPEAWLGGPSLGQTRGAFCVCLRGCRSYLPPGPLQQVSRPRSRRQGAQDRDTKTIHSPRLGQLKPWRSRPSFLRDLLGHLERPHGLTGFMIVGHS